MHVDGFRFDLATDPRARAYGFDEGGGFLDSCRQDPVLSSVKLIAEPWDCGPGGYQVGRFPPGWAEWNDRFRDTVRAFWKGDEGVAAELATPPARLAPTCSHARGRRPGRASTSSPPTTASRSHDLVTYNEQHNEANGEDNRDGHTDNRSWNCGVEGPTDDPEVLALRARQKRNLLATLLLSQGTPMLLAGDEFGRTQQGNNNAYCQDNAISLGRLGGRRPGRRSAMRFVAAAHRPAARLAGAAPQPLPHRRAARRRREGRDLARAGRRGDERRSTGTTARRAASACCSTAVRRSRRSRSPAPTRACCSSSTRWSDAVEFVLPPAAGDEPWIQLVDSALEKQASEAFHAGDAYTVTGRSMLVFATAGTGQPTGWLEDLAATLPR